MTPTPAGGVGPRAHGDRRTPVALGRPAIGLLLAAVLASGCSIKRIAINSLADTLAEGASVYASDEDPELVRDAIPFSLKTIESLLAEVPRHPGLLLSACSGFTQYAYAFLQTESEIVEPEDFDRAMRLRDRALKMYLRARGYCLRNLELRHAGISERFVTDPEGAVRPARLEDVPALYWTGAAWGAAIALGADRPELIADLPAVQALMRRALSLDEDYERGAIHEVMIALESLPESMGGSPERAREHFVRAVELSRGRSAGPYVSLAVGVAVPAQNRAEFEELLGQALAIDPDAAIENRLANLIAQRRARFLLDRADALFFASADGPSRVEADEGERTAVGWRLDARQRTWLSLPGIRQN